MPTALIVEDEPEANRLLSLLVQMRGYQTYSAYTGGDALEMADFRHPDLIFLDLMLPDTTGYDVCASLKHRRETTLIPVIVVTARVASESQVLSYRVGATGYVPKPYTPDQIFDAMAAARTWREAMEAETPRGEIVLDSRNEPEAFARLGSVQSLLLSHTPWDEESVHGLVADLMRLTQYLLAWGRQQRQNLVANLAFEARADRFVLTVRDLAGWSTSRELPQERGLDLLIAQNRFDSVERQESGREVVLTKQFGTSGNGAH